LKICEQTGEEINLDKIPPEFEDFPYDVQNAIITFSKLGDRIVNEVGYIGKDYTSLPIHLEIYQPDNKEIFLETLLRLDEMLIKRSSDEMKQARRKLQPKG
jgi:hypothetical protein